MPHGKFGTGNKMDKDKNSLADITDIIKKINNIEAITSHQVSAENQDIILRNLVKASARLYFKSNQIASEQKTQTSKTKYIPASGKIIDEKDLGNMIGSSRNDSAMEYNSGSFVITAPPSPIVMW